MPREHTIEDTQKAIAKLPKHARDYVRHLERGLAQKQEYIDAMENGLFGEREGDAPYFYYEENIRSTRDITKRGDRRWLPKYTHVGVALENGDEFEIGPGYQDPNTLDVKLGINTRGDIAVVTSGLAGSMTFKRIPGR